jgi:hypothetical protein
MRQLEEDSSDSEASSDARQSGDLNKAQGRALAEAGIPDVLRMDGANELEQKVASLANSLTAAIEQR